MYCNCPALLLLILTASPYCTNKVPCAQGLLLLLLLLHHFCLLPPAGSELQLPFQAAIKLEKFGDLILKATEPQM